MTRRTGIAKQIDAHRRTGLGTAPRGDRRSSQAFRSAAGIKPLLPVAFLVLAGCSNPLAPLKSDYGRVIEADRLRSIEPFHPPALPPEPEYTRPTADALRARIAGAEKVALTLEECRAAALENNLNLSVVLVDPAIANTSLSEAEARFEWLLFADVRHADIDTPTDSELTSAQQEFTSVEPGVRIPLRTGGNLDVTLPLTRNETNNEFATLNPSYTADLELTYSQPLLRNAGRHASTYAIQIASYNRQITEARTTLAVIGELAAVDRVYWLLVQALRELDVRQRQYEVAVAQLERAERQERAGRVAEIEVVRAQAGVADSLDAIIQAENAVLLRQRELKRRLNLPGLDVDSPTLLTPATPPDPVRYALDPAELSRRALAGRMELLEIELQLLADAADIRLRRNELLPLVNADLTYRINGLGRSLGDAGEVLAENDFEDWSVGLRAEIPLGNQAARSRLDRALLTRLQRVGTRAAREQTVRQEVYDAVDRLGAAWQRIIAARQSVVLNRRALEAEQRQFDLGASTSTDVLIAAANLADAESAEITAIVDYQIAQIDLAQATGSLLGAARVRWTPAGGDESANARSPSR